MNYNQPEKPEQIDETETCSLCNNGGFCRKHSVRPHEISELQHHHGEENPDDVLVNEELQLAARRSKPSETLASNKEAAEYLQKLREETHQEGSQKRAS